MRYWLAIWVVASWASVAAAQGPPEPGAAKVAPVDPNAVSFRRDIAPLLVKNCVACHGAEKAQGNYRVDTFERLMKPGETEGTPLVAGKPGESELFKLVSSTDKDERMPKDGDPLPAAQVELIRKWIEQGLRFDGPSPAAPVASYLPRQPHPPAPAKYAAPVPVLALAFHPGGGELAVGGYHEVTIWNPTNGALIRRLPNVAQRTHALAYNGDGSLLAIAGGAPGRLGEVRLLKPADGSEVRFLQSGGDEILDVKFSPDGQRLATAASDRSIRIFQTSDGKEQRVIENHADWVQAVTWSKDGTKVASASRDKTAKVFEVATGNLLATYSGHGEAVYGVAFHADGNHVFTSGRDKKIHQWKVADAAKVGELGGFAGDAFKLEARDGQLFCGSADKTVRQFREQDRGLVRAYAGAVDWVFAAAWHPGTKRLAAAGYDGGVTVWNSEDGKIVTQFPAAPGYTVSTGK